MAKPLVTGRLGRVMRMWLRSLRTRKNRDQNPSPAPMAWKDCGPTQNPEVPDTVSSAKSTRCSHEECVTTSITEPDTCKMGPAEAAKAAEPEPAAATSSDADREVSDALRKKSPTVLRR